MPVLPFKCLGFSEGKHLPNFRITEAALEELTASFNDHAVIVNEGELLSGETKELRARTLRSFAYRLAEGQSKGFSQTIHRPRTFYRTIFIGSIENLSVPKHNLILPNRISGSEVRLFDIPAVKEGAADIFDRAPKTLHGSERKYGLTISSEQFGMAALIIVELRTSHSLSTWSRNLQRQISS